MVKKMEPNINDPAKLSISSLKKIAKENHIVVKGNKKSDYIQALNDFYSSRQLNLKQETSFDKQSLDSNEVVNEAEKIQKYTSRSPSPILSTNSDYNSHITTKYQADCSFRLSTAERNQSSALLSSEDSENQTDHFPIYTTILTLFCLFLIFMTILQKQ